MKLHTETITIKGTIGGKPCRVEFTIASDCWLATATVGSWPKAEQYNQRLNIRTVVGRTIAERLLNDWVKKAPPKDLRKKIKPQPLRIV